MNDCTALDDVVERVRQIEEDKELWCRMIAEPWQTEEQIERQEKEMNEYKEFISNIFNQNLNAATRKAQGTYPEEYRKWYRQGFYMAPDEIVYRIGRKLQKHS